ncbi:MAG: carbohydrate kinase family protein [Planctomycetota bacterium]
MGTKIFCFGTVVADFITRDISEIPAPGDSARSSDISLAVGGCAANTATGLARLGHPVSLCGAVGDDDLGTFLHRDLTQEGVQLDHLSVEPGISTAVSLIINVTGQDRRIISAPGANEAAWPDRFDEDQLQEAAVVSFHGYGLSKRPDVEDTERILRAAKRSGATTVLDVIVIPGEDLLADLKRLLPLVDVFLPNLDEARRLTGETDPRAAASQLRGLGATTVVVTCGDQGLAWESSEGAGVLAALAVDEVDATGCGDAFAAGWIDAVYRGADFEEKLLAGSSMGALVAMAPGAIEGLPQRAGLDDMMQSLQRSLSI